MHRLSFGHTRWRPDVCTPKMTAIDLCERTRDHSQVPMIILSVRGDEKDKMEARRKKVIGFEYTEAFKSAMGPFL